MHSSPSSSSESGGGLLRSTSARGMTDNLCAHSTRRWRQKAMTGRAEGGRYRRECAPRSRYFQADQRYVAARLCSCVFGLGHLRLLAALCVIPPIAVLAHGTAVPLVGSHGAAGLVRLIVTLMPPALLLPHAGPASSEHHAIALQPVGARQAGRAGRVRSRTNR